MATSIKPNASSRVAIVPGTTPLLTGALSVWGAIYYNTNSANGQYEVPVQVWQNANGASYFEIFRAPPDASGGTNDVPNHTYLFYRNAGGQVLVDLGDATLYGSWIFFCWTQSATGSAKFYAAKKGFTVGSPTYLITPTQSGTVLQLGDRIHVGQEKSDSTTVCLTTSIAVIGACELELTEAQISGSGGVWTQRAVTAAASAGDYCYLVCDNSSTPGNDTGSPGTDWTVTGTWADGESSDPWASAATSLALDSAGTRQLRVNAVYRM